MRNRKKASIVFIFSFVLAFMTITTYQNNCYTNTVMASSKIKLNESKVTLAKGEKTQLYVSKGKAVWSTSNKSVATVSSKGKVTALKKGEAVITAKVGNQKLTCKVTVIQLLSVSTHNLTCDQVEAIEITYDTDEGEIYYEVEDESVVQCAYADEWDGNKIKLYINPIKAGTTNIYITNSLNHEKETIKVQTVMVYSDEEKMAAFGIILLDQILRNPDSLAISEMSYVIDESGNSTVYVNYTAENGYGGTNSKCIEITTKYGSNPAQNYELESAIGNFECRRYSAPIKKADRVVLNFDRVISYYFEADQFIINPPTTDNNNFKEKDPTSNEINL